MHEKKFYGKNLNLFVLSSFDISTAMKLVDCKKNILDRKKVHVVFLVAQGRRLLKTFVKLTHPHA